MTFIDDLNPERFLVAGDWHANFNQAQAARKHAQRIGDDVKVIVQLGDFMYDSQNFLNYLNRDLEDHDFWLLFVDGNHEDFNYINSVPAEAEGHRFLRSRIIHLPRGLRWEWGHLQFAALGGAHSVDRDSRLADRSWWDGEWVTDLELERFREGGPTDVVFMHDSPAGAPNSVTDNPIDQARGIEWFGEHNIALATEHRRRLAAAIDPTDPSLIMHGHYHEKMSGYYTREDGRRCRVIGLNEGGSGVAQSTMLFDTVQLLPVYGRDYTTTEETE